MYQRHLARAQDLYDDAVDSAKRAHDRAIEWATHVRNYSPGYQLSPGEQRLVEALLELGGVASLSELRVRTGGMSLSSAAASQDIYGNSVFAWLGPAIYGLRGWRPDGDRLASLLKQAEEQRRTWSTNGGWLEESAEVFRYRLPSQSRLPSEIRLPRNVFFSFSRTVGPTGFVNVVTQGGRSHSLPVRATNSSVRLGGVRSLFDAIQAGPGDEIEFTKVEDAVWQVSRRPVTASTSERVSVRLGRGWIAVSY